MRKKLLKPIGVKSKFPGNISPMLATLVDQPFDEEGWTYEVKWDGYRALGFINNKKVELKSRNNKSFNDRFYPVTNALKKIADDMIIDGEIIVANKEGISNFGDLQNWRSEADGQLQFYVFDLLWLNGYSLMHLPLHERRKKLEQVISENEIIQFSKEFRSTGTEFFKIAGKANY